MSGFQVVCYAGSRYAEEPRALVVGGCSHEVRRVEARWRTPAGAIFRVEIDLGLFVVSYDELRDVWSVDRIPNEGGEELSGDAPS